MYGGHARTSLATLGIAALLTATATACADDEPAAQESRLTFATDQVPQCLDPAVSPQDVTALIGRNIFDSLVHMSSDGTFRPWLAEKWTVSPDGKTYTFSLRPGVTFSDGTPLDAAAVKTSLDHVVDPATKSIYAARLISAYDSATAVDDHTVVVTLKHASTPFLQALSTTYLGIQSPASLKTPGPNCAKPVGSGPFTLASWTRNVSLELVRNPKYQWGQPTAAHTGPAKLDKIKVQFITESSARLGALTSGQVDVIEDVPPESVETLKAAPGLQFVRKEIPGAVFTIYLNASTGPLADERVRKALLRAVDLDSLIKSAYFGQFQRAWSVLSPATIGYAEDVENAWSYDPAAAGKLLDEAGWTSRDAQGYRVKDGKRLILRWPYVQQFTAKFTTVAQGLQEQAKQAGIELDLTETDSGTFGKEFVQRKLDLYSTSFVRAEPDILRLFFTTGQSSDKGGGNVLGVTFPELDKWLDGAETSNDQAARITRYVQAQKFIAEHALALPTYVAANLVGYSSRVEGLTFEANGYPLFYDVSIGKAE